MIKVSFASKKKKKGGRGVLLISFVLTVNMQQTPAQVNTAQALVGSQALLVLWICQLITYFFRS